MNLNLLQLLGKYIILSTMSLMSFFNIGNYKESQSMISNNNVLKDYKVINNVTKYDTVIEYNAKLPSNVKNVVSEGVVGLSYSPVLDAKASTEKTEETIVQDVKTEVVEQGTGKYGIYNGKLVGYGPDCKGCSGEGYLACKTEDGSKFSLKYNGIYYTDDEYGSVRILAAQTSQFPCGTIVKVVKPDGVNFLAVVLDKIGTTSTSQTIMDLAYSSQTDKAVFGADGLTGNNITYYIQRWGW